MFQIGTEEAFQDAKRKLNNKFGKTNILTEAYRSKLEHWPPVKEHDGEALEELVSFLESCKTAMKKLPELQCLNDRRENEKIFQKLPISIGNRWVKRATQIETSTNKFPSIFDFIHFLSKEADVASNSLNKAVAKRAISDRKTDYGRKQNKPTHKQANHATTLLTAENQTNHQYPKNDSVKPKRARYPCLMCNVDNHTTGICFKLEKLNHADIEKFFK